MPDLDFEALDAPETELLAPAEPAAPATPAVAAAPAAEPPAAPEPAAAAPAPAAAPVPQASAAPEPEERIPLAAHLAERRRLQGRIDELEGRANRTAALEAELTALKARLEPQAPAEPKEPDYLEDPKGYVDRRVERAVAGIKQEAEAAKQGAQAATEETRFQAFMGDLSRTEAEFRTRQPDYADALKHVRLQRAEQLALIDPSLTEQQIIQQLMREELAFAAAIVRRNGNPHEAAYRYAQTMGYRPPAPAAPAPSAPAPAAPAAPQAPARLPATETLGASAGIAPDAGAEDLGEDPDVGVIESALAERFGRRRA